MESNTDMNSTLRKVFALLLTVMLLLSVLSLAGCHKKDAEVSDSKVSTAAQETKKKGGILSDLLGRDEEETTTKKASEKASTTVAATKGTVTAADTTTAAAATKATEATTLSSGLFQVSSEYKASHQYAVAVNTAQNIVIVYAKGADGNYTVPVKAMACSCGRSGHETPSGQYTTLAKQRWLYLIDGTYGQYCTKFKEHYWFHSVPYYTQDPSDLEWPEYNKLGNNASAGCVRMCVRDVKWVYDNLSIGTVVRVYSSGAQEPLAKPAPIRIDTSDTNEKRGWDPTDPDPNNPY